MANQQNLIPITSETAAILGAKGGTNKKGSKHISTWIQELLNDEEFTTTIREGKAVKNFKGAPAKAIVQAQMRMALEGDVKAADLLFKYGYGTKLTHANDTDNPLTDTRKMNKEELEDEIRRIVGSSTTSSGALRQGTESPQSQN